MADPDKLLRNGVPMVAGVVLLSVAGWLHHRDTVERAHWVEVRGTIVEVTRERDGENWAPVVEFEANGERLRSTGMYSSSKPATGGPLFVRYDPAAPASSAQVLGALDGLVLPSVVLLGFIALVGGLVGAVRSRREPD
ncbi:MAG: hypothetical protein DI536_31015 [Archangium gephyra]|uniref:DUF3592 domain-containing protein n=1 Tax=Archangium gephyra TaxID=48 RepID=A0A2W5T3Q7_9BACT|nr:MAG: hypothetical protein DI536_31015 [Archangium gephyra]